MQQEAGTLQMAQELVPQPGALRGAFDQSGDVSHHKAFLGTHPYHAQVGIERGEGVIGDLGARVADRADER